MLRDKEAFTIVVFLSLVLVFTGLVFFYIQGGALEASPVSEGEIPEKSGGVFSIRIVNAEGVPVPDARVSLTDGEKKSEIRTDGKGGAFFSDLVSQRFFVSVQAAGYRDKAAWFMAGAEEVMTLAARVEELEILLRMQGSNTIGAKYAPALAMGYLEGLGAAEIRVESLGGPEEQRVSGVKEGRRLAVEIRAHGSTTAFSGLKDGVCDIGMASRQIRDEEALALQHLGDMRGVASEHVVGLDGIAVIVHPGNPLEALQVESLAEIFGGGITTWAEAGGALEGGIRICARDGNSGTFDTFKSLVLEKRPLSPEARRFSSNAELSETVAGDPMAIGFTGLPYVQKSKAVAVSVKGGAKVFPTFFTVATEDYPLSRRLYLYTASASPNPHVLDFIHYALSDEGQKKAAACGFVDLGVKTFTGIPLDAGLEIQDRGVVDAYIAAVGGAMRLSLNFRFRVGSFDLDSRGMRDLQRVISFLEKEENQAKEVILAGFTDSKGDYAYNHELALKRAKVVEDALRARGVYRIRSVSGGEELPIASNESPLGRSRNRRVEIWVK